MNCGNNKLMRKIDRLPAMCWKRAENSQATVLCKKKALKKCNHKTSENNNNNNNKNRNNEVESQNGLNNNDDDDDGDNDDDDDNDDVLRVNKRQSQCPTMVQNSSGSFSRCTK